RSKIQVSTCWKRRGSGEEMWASPDDVAFMGPRWRWGRYGPTECHLSVSGGLLKGLSPPDQGSRAMIREKFQQDRMGHLAVQDDHGLDAFLHGIDAGLDLRDHAIGDGPVGDQAPAILDGHFGNEILVLVEDARNV